MLILQDLKFTNMKTVFTFFVLPLISLQDGPRNTKVEVTPPGQILEGSTVTLTCKADANPPVQNYTWYKRGGYVPLNTWRVLLFSKIQPEDRGEYYCRAANGIGQHRDSPSVSVEVLHGPRNTKVEVDPSGQILEGSRVTLTCSSDANPPVQNYTWFKVNESTPVASGQHFNISNIRSEDAGHYYCEAGNRHGTDNSSAVSIRVKAGHSEPWQPIPEQKRK
ncbi:B-cell receptor CD22-like [Engraulis encrasicolus]|uniref:B-cell receptor CD22-like n=1 Tax=Engraulis encrasicolus TaxID=184585 RepID=UPI002FD103BC